MLKISPLPNSLKIKVSHEEMSEFKLISWELIECFDTKIIENNEYEECSDVYMSNNLNLK